MGGRGLVFGGRKEEKKRKCRHEMTRQREDFGPREGRRQTRVWGDAQRKMIEEAPAFGEYCNLKARHKPQEGAADEI